MSLILSQRVIDAGEYCYANFLSQKYVLTDAEKFPKDGTTIDGYVIQRPNHGLAHTMRKLYYLPMVVSAFKLSNIHTFNFNNIQLNLDSELENSLTALFFSVVGRESEASHKDDPVNYDRFRKNSADAYEYYIRLKMNQISEYQALVTSGKMEFYRRLIQSPRTDMQCVMSRIFRISHCLDLMRCYKESEYNATLESIKLDLGTGTGLNQNALSNLAIQLKEYAARCIEACGDKNLALGKSRNGKLFIACSISLKICSASLEKVSYPAFISQLPPKVNPSVINLPKSTNQILHAPTTTPLASDFQSQYEHAKTQYTQHPEIAFIEFKKLAVAGFGKAQYMTGVCYYYGKGTKIDYERAHKYLDFSAKQNNVNAHYMLGVFYYEGKGAARDIERSKQYFIESAKLGNGDAKKALANLFNN